MSNAIEEIKFVGPAAVEQLISNTKDALDNKQPKGNYVTETDLSTAVESALEQAKNSGEFDGEQGEPGRSGVYVGSGDMPDDCNVQIDPEGTALTLEALTAAVIAGLPLYNGEVVTE